MGVPPHVWDTVPYGLRLLWPVLWRSSLVAFSVRRTTPCACRDWCFFFLSRGLPGPPLA